MTPEREPDAAGASLERAWRELARDPGAHVGSPGFTRARIERAIQLIAAVACGVMGVQALLIALPLPVDAAELALRIVVFSSLAAMIACCLAGVAVRATARVFAAVFPAALVVWFAGLAPATPDPSDEPWPFYLLTVATGAAIVALPVPLQIVSAVGLPALFAVGRLLAEGGVGAYAHHLWYDLSVAVLIALTFVLATEILRRVAARVDAVRESAVATYSAASAVEAAEQERVEVAALMHDSVLAALLASARASSDRERALAVEMAREALVRLADAERDSEMGPEGDVGLAQLVDALRAETAVIAPGLAIDAPETDARLSAQAARAAALAAAQAVANAVEHAEGRGLRVEIRADGDELRVRVADEGAGFDPSALPRDRLGIRGSIVARVAAAGGRAHVSSSGRGTLVEIGIPLSGARP
ncbi:ATP-binding protein [Microbacterium sp. gxy059]|uniref:ATP-binding protein n=1 Tax=Microbacterium sp. gxy059 TaxID=2957199 RepID=UPI003D967C07